MKSADESQSISVIPPKNHQPSAINLFKTVLNVFQKNFLELIAKKKKKKTSLYEVNNVNQYENMWKFVEKQNKNYYYPIMRVILVIYPTSSSTIVMNIKSMHNGFISPDLDTD